MAGGDTFTIIYLKLLLLSMKNEGKIYFDGIGNNFVDELEIEIDEAADNIRLTLNYLEQKGLLEIIDENEIFLNETLTMLGSESESAERVRNYRRNKINTDTNLLQCDNNVTEQCYNVTADSYKVTETRYNVQKCNTEIEREKEKELDIYIDIETPDKPAAAGSKNKKKFNEINDIINTYSLNTEIVQALNNFIEMRKNIKSPMTAQAVKILLTQLDKLAATDDLKIEILKQSILNNWKTVYQLKEPQQQKQYINKPAAAKPNKFNNFKQEINEKIAAMGGESVLEQRLKEKYKLMKERG